MCSRIFTVNSHFRYGQKRFFTMTELCSATQKCSNSYDCYMSRWK